MRLLQAEVLKLRTAPRTALVLVLGLLALVGLGSAATASDAESSPFGSEMVVWDVIGVTSMATIFTLILGILIVTWEYRHGTITQTYLSAPRRERVIGAKVLVAFTAGALLAAAAVAAALLVATFWVSLDIHGEHLERAARLVLGAALWGVLGAGLGAVLQSQVGAIVASFVWFLVAEPLIGLKFDSLADYLPGHVIDRLQQTSGGVAVTAEGIETAPDYPLSLWAAALVAAAYAAGFAVLGVASALWRDVP
jgi:ABC-2 type transport system permease protein